LGLIFKSEFSVEVGLKASYSYEQNKSEYDSDYSSRALSETQATDADDVITGRVQTYDIWRYRILGADVTSENQPTNGFYELILPGESFKFSGAGLSLDWYQPPHENGNILSYPAPTGGFVPPDLGPYDIPCPAGDTNCNADGTKTVTEPLLPASLRFLDASSGSITVDYVNRYGSGDTYEAQHKLDSSLDVKVAYKLSARGLSGEVKGNFNVKGGGSWGTLQTNDNQTTDETGITIARTPVAASQSYAIYPVYYITADGTFKVAYASDPLGSASGQSFWARLYGGKADPALNLPLRFDPLFHNNKIVDWTPNLSPSRKLIRGFSLLSPQLDPVTGRHPTLNEAPADGDDVLLSAQVYNYSTGMAFANVEVAFSAVKYNPVNDSEEGPRIQIGHTFVSLSPRQGASARVIWHTKGLGPTGPSGSVQYRIYVDIDPDRTIDEIYPPENPELFYGAGLPRGLDPGQNNEGFGYATVVSAGGFSTSAAPVHLYIGDDHRLQVNRAAGGKLKGMAVEGQRLRIDAQVCADAPTRDPIDLVVFDGPPSQGKVIAWRHTYVASATNCTPVWFDWVPSAAGDHNIVAEVLQDDDPMPGDNEAEETIPVISQ